MAQNDNMLEASFRGVTFDITEADDELTRAYSKSTSPYQNGGALDDQGWEPRQFIWNAVIFGDDYEQRKDALLNALSMIGPGELVHPVDGTFQAIVISARPHYEADNVDRVDIALVFLEHSAQEKIFNRVYPVQKAAAVAQAIDATREVASAVVSDEVSAIAGLKGAFTRVQLLRQTMTTALSEMRSKVNGVITSGLDVIGFPQAWARDIASLVSGIVDLRRFNVDTMSTDWRAIFDDLGTPVKMTPFNRQPVRDAAIINVHVNLEQAMGKADAAQAVIAVVADEPTLSAPEIEQLVNGARENIQASIDEYRAVYNVETAHAVIEQLKNTAWQLQEAARAVIELRPPLIQREVLAPGSLRLIAHRWYGDHSRALEILRLNPAIQQPNFIPAGKVLNVYAQ